MKKITLLVGALLAATLVACGGAKEVETTAEKEVTSEVSEKGGDSEFSDMKIALILPGTIDDQGWNATNNAGALACDEELGTKIDVIEGVPAEEYEQTFVEYGEKGYDLVMAAGSQFDEPCTAICENYPETKFCVINGQIADFDNQTPVFPKEYEGSYLSGIIAGYTTKDGKFAVLGGESNVPMLKLLDTYEGMAIECAKERGIEKPESFRAIMNTWTDVSIAKDMTSSMIDKGADTVFCFSNEATSGSIQAAQEKDAAFVGFGSNKNNESDCVVGSVEMAWPTVYPTIVKNVMDGTYTGKVEIGVKEGVFNVVKTDKMSDECSAAIDKAIEDINAGKVDFEAYFKTAE